VITYQNLTHMKKLLFVSMICCLFLSCSKKDTNDSSTPVNPTATAIQNLIHGKTISQVRITTDPHVSYGMTFANPVITFDQDFLIVNSTNYFSLDKITLFTLNPYSDIPGTYELYIVMLKN